MRTLAKSQHVTVQGRCAQKSQSLRGNSVLEREREIYWSGQPKQETRDKAHISLPEVRLRTNLKDNGKEKLYLFINCKAEALN